MIEIQATIECLDTIILIAGIFSFEYCARNIYQNNILFIVVNNS